ncbi:RNA-dependent RNA polymerase [Mycena indigotica]|uniref:RNA-dependent RNA polymerase n=1 Tax=Mycena indigotica TaxID=2126181 RepID=A0A8H6TCH3_9AGAR|nr:RNA-dependent RNA polymerase [Mycena indigotica]KAF7316033.1 RNA-dependent RNA polymerase [Mycena indigotica]
MLPPQTLKKQRTTFLRFSIDLRDDPPIPGDIEEYYGHESRATRAVKDSRRFMTVLFKAKNDKQIESWLNRKEKLYNAQGEEYTFFGFTENNVKNGHILYFQEGPDWSVNTLKRFFGEGLFDVYRRGGYGKYAARLGLSFSSTAESLEILPQETHMLQDITADDGSLTSDGSGLIRDSFALEVIAFLQIPSETSVFQIRHGGYKGTVTRIPDTHFDRQCGTGKKVAYRPSMLKYTGGLDVLEIQSISRTPRVARVNKQFIILMLTRGISLQVIEEMLQLQLQSIGEMTTSRERALHYVNGELDSDEPSNGLVQEIYEMLLAGHDMDEPYLAILLHRFQKMITSQQRSYYLFGVVDPYGILQDGQVYINLPNRGGPQVGSLAFLRNPAYDADGYVVLEGVNVPQLSHIVNAIVFPAGGRTSQAARMSGGDLDGDLYFVTTYLPLIPEDRPPLPAAALPVYNPPSRRGGIGAPPSQMPGPPDSRGAESRITDEDMFRDAIKTFTDHRHNFLLGSLSNEFMKRVVTTRQLADADDCRALLPLILAALDALKNNGAMALLRYEFWKFKNDNPERTSTRFRDPLVHLANQVPTLGPRVIEEFRPDPHLILKDSIGADAWGQRIQETVPIMNDYGRELQTAIAADDEAKARKLEEDDDEKRADLVKQKFFEREFPELTQQNVLVRLPESLLKASIFYATGYAHKKQSFAWLGARFLNYLKALFSGRNLPIPIGPASRPLRPIGSLASTPRPPSAPSLSRARSGASPAPSPPPSRHTPAGSVAHSSQRSISQALEDPEESAVSLWVRETRQAQPGSPTPSEYRVTATPAPSIRSEAITISSSATSRVARIPLPPSVAATENDLQSERQFSVTSASSGSRARQIPLPESTPSTPGAALRRQIIMANSPPSIGPPSSAATPSTGRSARHIPLPNSVPATPDRSVNNDPSTPRPSLRRQDSDTDIEDDGYDLVRPESADEAEASHFHSPPRRVIS